MSLSEDFLSLVLHKFTIFSLVVLCLLFLWPRTSQAEALEISSNGESAVSSIEQDSYTSQTVVSSNESDTENTVQTSANSGNNSASTNTGDTSITTGTATNNTQVENSGNTSIIEPTSCCVTGSSLSVVGNGSGSLNSVSVTTQSTQTIDVANVAKINNTITTTSQTGSNESNNNVGATSITTGDVSVLTRVTNSSVNSSFVQMGTNSSSLVLNLSSNGAQSVNSITILDNTDTVIRTSNLASITNILETLANSGNNSANGNTGNVTINTGDVTVTTLLENVGINQSIVKVTSCCVTDPSDPGDPDNPGQGGSSTIPPSNSSFSNSSTVSGTGGNSAGTVLAYTIGQVLPATGGSFTLWATIFNVFMLLMGLYLRNRSGRSPAFLTIEITF